MLDNIKVKITEHSVANGLEMGFVRLLPRSDYVEGVSRSKQPVISYKIRYGYSLRLAKKKLRGK